MSEPVLLVKIEENVATVTLNRPQAMNALSRELRVEIAKTFSQLQNNPAVQVAIVTGAGRAFCAGLDLKELGAGSATVQSSVDAQDPVTSMAAFKRPIIGAINGVAITGGFELALACDVLVCSTEARFADTHGRVGILPGWGLSQKLSRAIGIYRAKELSLTGNFLSAQQAHEWGLVNRVVAPSELLPACKKLAADMCGLVPGFLESYKTLIDNGFDQNFGDALQTEKRTSAAGNKSVSAQEIEARREAVRARGKTQSTP